MEYAHRVQNTAAVRAGTRRRFKAAGLASASIATLAALAPASALAGSYIASDEASLKAAIASANADPDPNATITLTADIALSDPATTPAATKPITIDTDGFDLTGATINVSGDLTLAGDGEVRLTGSNAVSVIRAEETLLTVTGQGAAVNATGAAIGLNGGQGADLRVVDGGQLTSTGNITLQGAQSVATVSGRGSILNTVGASIGVNPGSTGTLNVENGGFVRSTGSIFVSVSGAGTVNVTGQGSLLEITSGLSLGTTGSPSSRLNITDGGQVRSVTGRIGAPFVAGGTPVITVSGGGSLWAVSGDLGLSVGEVSVLDSGVITANTSTVGGIGSARGKLLVSGPGSAYRVAGAMSLGSVPGASVTVANGGRLAVGGAFTVGQTAGWTGVLNVGGAEGQAAAAAGIVDVAAVTFGPGVGRINFNHTDAAFTFGAAVSGAGAVNQVGPGTTILTGDSTYTGGTTISAGRLQLGNGGASGAVAGNVTNNGALAFARSDTLTFGGVISGSGSVEQLGPGVTVLTAANTYGGGTVLRAGTLSVSQDASLGGGGLDFQGGVLRVTGTAFTGTPRTIAWGAAGGGFDIADAANTFTLAQPLVGGGSLTKLGDGALVLTADNSYTGTTIAAGRLQLGDGGPSGSIAGDVVNEGILAFNRSDALTVAGAISGSGALAQVGGGTTTLTGANTYAGGTTISAGTLRGSAASFGSGAILDNAALIIDQAADGAMANAIDGSGSFTKTGAGRLDYTGVGALAGPTTVSAGTLAVNGALANSAVTVLSGASLAGTGVVGAASVQGIVAPGNSIGALRVAGDLVQAAGSVYQAELEPDTGASDLIQVAGAATIAPGAILQVIRYTPGAYRLGAVYTVLTAAGGVNGTYLPSGDLTGVSAFLALDDSYDANNVYLRVVQTADPAAVVETPNQAAVVGALPPGGELEAALLNSPSVADALKALTQLAGDGHAAAKGMLMSDSRLVRDLAVDRLRDVLCAEHPNPAGAGACPHDPDRGAVWGQAFGAWGQVDGSAEAGNVRRATGGFLFGIDLPVAGLGRLGYFAGYSKSDLRLHVRTGEADVDNYHAGVYGGAQNGPVGLRFGAAYTWQGIETLRHVRLPGLANDLRARYSADSVQAFGEVGYRLALGEVTVEPFAGAAFVSVKTRAFSERGGPAALSARADEAETTFATLGVRPSADLTLSGAKATVRGLAGWRHAFGDLAPTQVAAFAGGPDFLVHGAPLARDAAVLELGLDMRLGETGTFGFTYGGEYSDHAADQSLRAQLTYQF